MNDQRVTKAVVDLDAIRHNLRQVMRQCPGARVLVAVKANAYGHGAVPVSKACLEAGASHLGVATMGEAIELRNAGIQAPILLFTRPFAFEREDALEHDVTVTLFDFDDAKALSSLAQARGGRARVHLEVDTGMGRLGCPLEQASQIAAAMAKLPNLNLEGLCTHFATSDESDKSFTRLQLTRLKQVLAECAPEGLGFELVHAANSGAVLDIDLLPGLPLDMVRPGIMLYGYPPSAETSPGILRPAMELTTRVIQTRRIKAGDGVSYGLTYRAKRDGLLAVLPIGYADGYNRLLSNRGQVWINGRVHTIAGRVCMDMCMVDVGNDSVAVGDEAVLMGRRPGWEWTADDIARELGTIPYEVTCWVSSRVPRQYLG